MAGLREGHGLSNHRPIVEIVGNRLPARAAVSERSELYFAQEAGEVVLFLEGQGMDCGIERKAFIRRQGQALEGIAIDKFSVGLPFVLEELQHLEPQGTFGPPEPGGVERHSPKDWERIIAERGQGPSHRMLDGQLARYVGPDR